MKNVIGLILGLGVITPIWYYLMYQVLVRVQATELMWFLFWVYVPVSIVVQIISKLIEAEKKG